MKRLFKLTVIITLLFSGKSYAQDFCYNKGDKMLNIGIMPFPGSLGYSYSYGGNSNSRHMTFPPLNINFQLGFHDFISAGISASHFGRVYKSSYVNYVGYENVYKDSYNYTTFGVLGEVHIVNMLESFGVTFPMNEKIDLYGGISTGLYFESWKSEDVYYDYYWNNQMDNSSSTDSRGIH